MKLIISSFILCALFVSIPTTAFSIGYTGNLTGAIDANLDWTFRETNIATWDLTDLIGCGAFFSSLSVSGSSSKFSLGSIWGAASVVTEGWPVVWLAYWDASVTFDDTSDWLTIGVSGAEGYIAHSYVSLIEKNPSGAIVTVESLEQGLLPGTLGYDVTSGANPAGTLKWVTFTSSKSGEPWTISLTFLMSDVLGVVNYGNAIVGPKSIETIIEIKNWPYANAANTLSLVMGAATGNISAHGSSIIAGSGKNQIYFSLSGQATVNGQVTPVQVSTFESGNFDTYFDDDNIEGQLAAAYVGYTTTVSAVTVTFPAGASDIVYDPSVGVGQQPQKSHAATVVAYNVVLLFSVLLLL